MRNLFTLFVLSASIFAAACVGEQKPATPVETFKTYIKAQRKKDTTAMKLLLTAETLQAHEQEAKAMGTTVDEIVKRDSMIGETQTAVEFRNETIDGEKATLEVKNAFREWEKVFFLLENGEWKIDKKGYADQLLREVEENNLNFDQQNNFNTSPFGNTSFPTPQPIDPINANKPVID